MINKNAKLNFVIVYYYFHTLKSVWNAVTMHWNHNLTMLPVKILMIPVAILQLQVRALQFPDIVSCWPVALLW